MDRFGQRLVEVREVVVHVDRGELLHGPVPAAVADAGPVAAEDAVDRVRGTGQGESRVVPLGEQHVRLAPRREQGRVVRADPEALEVEIEADAEGIDQIEVGLSRPAGVFTADDRRIAAAGQAEVLRREVRVGVVGGIVPLRPEVHPREGMDADLAAVDVVAVAGQRVQSVVEILVRRIDFDIVDPVEDAAEVEHRIHDVLHLRRVRGVLRRERAGGVVGTLPVPEKRYAGGVPGQLAVRCRALDQDAPHVVPVDVADPADDEGIEVAPVLLPDDRRVHPAVARCHGQSDAAELDVLVGARVELAAVAGDAVAGARGATARVTPPAAVRPVVLVEAALQARVNRELLGELAVHEQLDLRTLPVVPVAFSGHGGEVVERARVALVAPEELRVDRPADRDLRGQAAGPRMRPIRRIAAMRSGLRIRIDFLLSPSLQKNPRNQLLATILSVAIFLDVPSELHS